MTKGPSLYYGWYFFAAGNLRDKGLICVGKVDYSGQSVDFEKITAGESDGDIVLDLNTIKEKKTTTFDFQGISFVEQRYTF